METNSQPKAGVRKERRITVRVSDRDLALLRSEAERLQQTVGSVIRRLIDQSLPAAGAAEASDTPEP